MSKYKTKDIFEASLLYSKQKHLIGLEKDGHYYFFIFKQDNNDCDELSKQYWSGIVTVNAKDFVDSQKTLKDLVFSKGGNLR